MRKGVREMSENESIRSDTKLNAQKKRVICVYILISEAEELKEELNRITIKNIPKLTSLKNQLYKELSEF